jgi:hypothetical protein
MDILIPGGSGQVGTVLARHLTNAGHDVIVLSRTPKPAPWKTLAWGLHQRRVVGLCASLCRCRDWSIWEDSQHTLYAKAPSRNYGFADRSHPASKQADCGFADTASRVAERIHGYYLPGCSRSFSENPVTENPVQTGRNPCKTTIATKTTSLLKSTLLRKLVCSASRLKPFWWGVLPFAEPTDGSLTLPERARTLRSRCFRSHGSSIAGPDRRICRRLK